MSRDPDATHDAESCRSRDAIMRLNHKLLWPRSNRGSRRWEAQVGEREFALYRGDEFLCVGTARELAEKFGVTVAWIKYMSTPAHQRRIAKTRSPSKARFAVKVEQDDD